MLHFNNMSLSAKFVTDSCLAITLQKLLWVCFSAGSDQINFLTGQGVTSSQFANHQMLWTSHPYVFVRKRSRSRPWPRPVNYELKKKDFSTYSVSLFFSHLSSLSHSYTHFYTHILRELFDCVPNDNRWGVRTKVRDTKSSSQHAGETPHLYLSPSFSPHPKLLKHVKSAQRASIIKRSWCLFTSS